MGAEQSRTVGQKLIDFSQQVTEPTTDRDKLGELIHDALQTLPTKVQKDIKTLIRGQRQHRVSGSTTLAAAPIVTIPNIILSNPNIKPAEFFDCQLKFTGLCKYISDIDINSESNIIRLRFALKQFYLTISSWGRNISKLEDQLREKGDTLPAKSTRSDWKKEGLAYKKFVDFYGHVQNKNKLQAAKDTALSCEETGKTFSRYLAEKQHADGLYSETIARAEDGASAQTYDQPSVDCSLVDSREVQHTTASSLSLISDQGVVPETVNSASQAEVATPSSQGTPSRCRDDLSSAFGLSAYNNSPDEASMHMRGSSSMYYNSPNANAEEVASAGSPSSVCLPTITGPSTPQLQSNRSEEERSPKRQKTQHGPLLRLGLPAGDETSEPHHGSRTSHHSHGHLSEHDMNLGDCAVVSAEYNLDCTQDEHIPTLSLSGQNVSSVNTSPLCLGAVKNTSAPSSPENGPQQNVPDPGREPCPVVSSDSDAEVMTTEPTSQAAILESITAAQNPSHTLAPAELVPNVSGTIGSREQQDLPPVRLLLDAVDGRTPGDQEFSNTQHNLDVQGLDFGNHFVSSFRSSEGVQVEHSLNFHYVANSNAKNDAELNGLTLHHEEGYSNQAVSASQRNPNPDEIANSDGNIDHTPRPMSSRAWVNTASDEFTIPEDVPDHDCEGLPSRYGTEQRSGNASILVAESHGEIEFCPDLDCQSSDGRCMHALLIAVGAGAGALTDLPNDVSEVPCLPTGHDEATLTHIEASENQNQQAGHTIRDEYDFPAAELDGVQLDINYSDEFLFPDFLDDIGNI
ncbi:unnamed protein product [Clonostachys chloroleuca]|uniref:Uncharacterized protein n=1 Tax=Clonostachys chloroleuca TaxID=1926264 RepID=A0AA35LRE3_9HYPO|nr:unnamed protein product [Clonostachys chloroleuca]